VSPVEWAAALAFWGGLVAAAVRWPGRAIGVSTALVLWTLAPWGFWTALGLTTAGAMAWRVFGPSERLGVAGGVGWLAYRPSLAAVIVAVAAVAFGGDVGALVGFAVLIATAGWLAWPRTRPNRPLAAGYRRAERVLPRRDADAASLGPGEVRVAASGPCIRCGAPTVSTVRAPVGPASVPDLAGVIARAVCVECGARLVGVVDPARPAGGLVWFEMPDSEVGL
jgi:hypothetical protein